MKNSRSILIIASILLVASIAGYYFFYAHFLEINTEVGNSTVSIAKDRAEENRVIDLRTALTSLSTDKTLLDSFFVPKEDVADFLQSVENLADGSNLQHTLSVGTQSDATLDPYDREWLTVTVSTVGSFSDTMRFLSLLESMPVKTSFQNMNLNVSDHSASGTPVWSSTVAFEVIKTK